MSITIDKILGKVLMHSHKASDISDLDTEISNNPDVSANTTHRETTSGNPHNVTLSDIGGVDTSDVDIPELGSATYDKLNDWINTTQSVGKVSGGDITDNGDGTVSVTAGTGFMRATDSDTAEIKSFDWSADTSVSLTDDDTNYIYVDYNAGSPQITSSTSMPTDHNTKILLGLAYRDGTDAHITTAGQIIGNYASKTFWKDISINGKFQRASGLIISEETDRKFSITSGIMYAGLTKVNISAFDSSGTDTFTYMYRDGSGGYTEVDSQTQIDNTHYDDGSGTLATLSSSIGWRTYYGVHWVYMNADGHVFVLYGRDSYLLSDAENAQPPSDIPDLLADIGGLIGKIIIEKDGTSFISIQSAFDVTFSPSAASEHNLLAGLQGGKTDEYYHLTEVQHERVLIKKTGISIDGGGDEITTGEHGFIYIPFSGTIKSVTLIADKTGSIKIDIWKDTYANYPPTDADSICGGNEPEISSGVKYQDTTLTDWTTTVNDGDVLKFNVDSCSTITKVTLVLEVEV